MKKSLLTLLCSFLFAGSYAQVGFTETFDSLPANFPPSGWTYTSTPFKVVNGIGTGGTKGLSRAFSSIASTDSIISPLILTSNLTFFQMDYRIITNSGGVPAAFTLGPGDSIIVTATDNVDPWITLFTISSATHTPAATYSTIMGFPYWSGVYIKIKVLVKRASGDFTVDIDNFMVLESTDVNDNDAEAGLLVYPNPVGDRLTIQSDHPGTLHLLDNTGRTVYISDMNENLHSIDMSQLSGGLYFMEFINTDNGRIIRKIIR